MVPDSIRRGSRGPPHQASSLESWEVEANGREEETEVTGVLKATLGQGSSWGHCPFGRY